MAYRTGLDSRRLLSPRRNVEQWQCVRVGPSVASAGDRHGDQRLGAVQRARRHRADRADSSLSLAAWSPRCSRSSDWSIAARSSIARRSPRSSGSMAASSLSWRIRSGQGRLESLRRDKWTRSRILLQRPSGRYSHVPRSDIWRARVLEFYIFARSLAAFAKQDIGRDAAQ